MVLMLSSGLVSSLYSMSTGCPLYVYKEGMTFNPEFMLTSGVVEMMLFAMAFPDASNNRAVEK